MAAPDMDSRISLAKLHFAAAGVCAAMALKVSSYTRLGDIARVELGASDYALRSLLNNKPAVGIPIFEQAGANSLQVSSNVKRVMAELKKSFPEGVDYTITYDTTEYVQESIDSVRLCSMVALVTGRLKLHGVGAISPLRDTAKACLWLSAMSKINYPT